MNRAPGNLLYFKEPKVVKHQDKLRDGTSVPVYTLFLIKLLRVFQFFDSGRFCPKILQSHASLPTPLPACHTYAAMPQSVAQSAEKGIAVGKGRVACPILALVLLTNPQRLMQLERRKQ